MENASTFHFPFFFVDTRKLETQISHSTVSFSFFWQMQNQKRKMKKRLALGLLLIDVI